ncbi:MAG TPA: sigma 54-interacting transcriptional regulator [Gemmatimonadales bacterium]|nr:sigma 54-interacting transcriptional regulator [Gemmatimonadales bacterium]
MKADRILIVEDDALLRSVLAERLSREGYDVATAGTLAEARASLDAAPPDLVFLDLRLPDGEGLALLREEATHRDAVWVVMTAHGTVSAAVEALKLGARDFLEKPFTLERALATAAHALEMTVLRREVAALRERSSIGGSTIVGEGPAMQRVFSLLRRLAPTDTTVLIEGESGTGKGATAQALHRLSSRTRGPFLNVTCSALPETLMESELFGHEKGAFTDARTAKRGLVEMADGGTLFLDEIAELTPGVQAKLLRFIEEKTFRRLGGTRDLRVDVRIVAATNRDLGREVSAGRFRADLFYRLRVVPIVLPPLRERPEDIVPLVKHFLDHFNGEFGRKVREVSPEALARMQRYSWPGNVRELRNVMERAVLLAEGETIGLAELPRELMVESLPAPSGQLGALEEAERRLLVEALERAGGNQSRAAIALGISRHQIRTRMKRWGLLVAALLAAAGVGPIRAQASAELRQSAQCERCHGEREVLAQRVPVGWSVDSLLVSREALRGTAHEAVPCIRCHPIPGLLPHPQDPRATVPCATCHQEADSLWRAGPHYQRTPAAAGGSPARDGASCVSCHGTHGALRALELESGSGLRQLTARCVSCHGDRVLPPGDVHRDRVNCASCHGAHMIQPVRDPATNGIPLGVAERCAACHDSVATMARVDVHGLAAAAQARGERAIHGDTAATCVACHGGHGMQPARKLEREVGLVELCGSCHRAERESYGDTYHGRATRLGYFRAARCDDCHTGHRIFHSTDPRASTHAEALSRTCGRCHRAASRPSFVQYRSHVRPQSPDEGLAIFGTWLFMDVLLFSVFTVFGLHTVFWLKRLLELRWQERRRRLALGLPPREQQRVALDSADRGEGPYVWRFTLAHRLVHGISVVSFFALVITGLPLRFSCAVWAPGLMALLGGTRVAGIIHRVAGAITVGYFLWHLGQLAVSFARSKDRKSMLWGPDSMVPQPRDFRDFLQMWKWFFGKAPFPRFGRYGYNEKFHYFGAFWGIVLLGGSGLVRWFPGVATAVLPGWAFNVAAILHSEEALLAAGFMFLIHFFNVHIRPDKFPMDGVMFTGRVRAGELLRERAGMAEVLADVSSLPVSRAAVPDLPAPPPPRWMTYVAAVGGLGALAAGLVIVGMVMWVQLC